MPGKMVIRLHSNCLLVFLRVDFKPTGTKRQHGPSKTLATISHQSNVQISDPGLFFHEKILYLENLKVNPHKALQQNPDFRSCPLSILQSVEDCLPRSAHGRILDMYPQLLTSDPHADLYPVLDFLLNEVCLPFQDIQRSIIRCPRILICGVDEQLKPALAFLRDCGFRGSNKITCQTTMLLVSNVEHTLVPKIDYLQSLGFACRKVVNMVIRSPHLLTYSIEKKNFKPKVEYFLEEMNGDLVELSWFPQYFSYSLEGKIKPRHQQLVRQLPASPVQDVEG